LLAGYPELAGTSPHERRCIDGRQKPSSVRIKLISIMEG
jgi:hypothetical protein